MGNRLADLAPPNWYTGAYYPQGAGSFTRLSTSQTFGDTAGIMPQIVFHGSAVTYFLVNNYYSNPVYNSYTYPVRSWSLRSFTTGLVVATGAIGSPYTSITLPFDTLPCGAYRLYLFDGSSNYVGGSCLISTRNVTGMPPAQASGVNDETTVFSRALIGTARLRIGTVASWASDNTVNDEKIARIQSLYTPYDTSRAKHTLMAFPNGTAGQASNVTAAVARYGTNVDYWEGQNEPGSGGFPDSAFVATQQEFYNAVKAGRSAAKVLGPCPVHIGGSYTFAHLPSYLAAGGGSYIDVWSVHTYNAHQGDLMCGRRTWDSFVATLTTYGEQNKPRAITEAGSFFAAEGGAGTFIRQAHRWILDILLAEQYGVQKESYWPYFGYDGGNPYPSYTVNLVGGVFPVIGMMMTHAQELLGTAWESRLDFGTIDNEHLIGSTYRRSSDSTGVVSLLAGGRENAPVTLQLTGGSPSSVTVVDCWGNTSTATVSGGLVTVTAGIFPVYVELPASVHATVVATSYGTDRYTGSGASASAGDAGGIALANVLTGTGGTWPNRLYWNADNNTTDGASVYATTSTSFPQDIDIPVSGYVDTVLVHCPPGWEANLSTILKMDIQTGVSGTFTTRKSIDATPTLVNVPSTIQDGADAWFDSFSRETHVWVVKLDARIPCDTVRIHVTQNSLGGAYDTASYNAYGGLNSSGAAVTAGLGTSAANLNLQRVRVFDSGVNPPAPSGTKFLMKAGAFN